MIKAVLDTHVLISGLLWTGTPRRILQAADEERFFLFTSTELLEELACVLQRPQFKTSLARRESSFKDVLAQIVRFARLVIPKPLSGIVVTRDPSDDMVLACAVTAGADAIVTGDEHLLELKEFRKIPVMTPVLFLRLLGK